MNSRPELERWDRRGINVSKAERRMMVEQMPTAFAAIMALAERSLLEHCDMLLAVGDPHPLRLPQSECVDRRSRPGPARRAVAIAHHCRLAGHLDGDRSAKAFSTVGHVNLLLRLGIGAARSAPEKKAKHCAPPSLRRRPAG